MTATATAPRLYLPTTARGKESTRRAIMAKAAQERYRAAQERSKAAPRSKRAREAVETARSAYQAAMDDLEPVVRYLILGLATRRDSAMRREAGYDKDDRMQAVWLKMPRVLELWNPDLGLNFITYFQRWAFQCMQRQEWHMGDALRPARTSHCSPRKDRDWEWPLETYEARGESDVMQPDELALLAQLLDQLPERHRQIVSDRYGLGGDKPMTLVEVGKRWGLTKERARQIVNAAIVRMSRIAQSHTFPIPSTREAV